MKETDTNGYSELLTMKETAELLNVSLSMVKKLCAKGKLEPTVKIGTSRRIKRSIVQKVINGEKVV